MGIYAMSKQKIEITKNKTVQRSIFVKTSPIRTQYFPSESDKKEFKKLEHFTTCPTAVSNRTVVIV
jgi:hypothetical protein